MTNNTNNGSNKPGSNADRDRKKANPSVPAAANRGQRSAEAGATKPAGSPSSIKPANPAGGVISPSARPQTQMSARALSRYEKDMRRQRQLVWAVIGVVVFIVLVLAFGIWQTTLAPSFETVGSVNGQGISRSDYNKYRKLEIFKQVGSLQQQQQFSQGDQQQQLASQIALLQDEVANISDRKVNQTSLESLVKQIVLEKAAKDKYGISVSDDEVSKYLGQEFKDVIYTPTPNPTQALQTQTAAPVATQAGQFATATASAVTPLPTATSSVPATTTVASAAPGATPGLTPGVTAGTPDAATTPGATPAPTFAGTPGTPGASPSVSTTVQPTITPTATATATAIAGDKVEQTVTANQSSYLKGFRTFTGLSDDDYRKLEVRPTLLKKKVVEKLRETVPKVGTPYPASQVSHILVKDEATAKQISDQLKAAPADKQHDLFVQLAREKSTDTTAASHNGDLGWVTDKTQFDKDFLAAALKLEKGQISEPVKTQFGYHIIYCTDKDPKRLLDALTIQSFEQADATGDPQFYSDWITQQVKDSKVSYNTPPTPAPTATLVPVPVFTPVVPPTVTPVPPTAVPTTAPAGTTPASGTTVPAGSTTASAGTTAASTTASIVTTVAPTTTSAAATTTAVDTTAAPTPTK